MIAMNKQKEQLKCTMLLLTFFILAVSGCATSEYKKLAVNIEIEEPPRLEIFNVAVRSQDSNTRISGKIHKKSHGRTVIPGHLDILVLSIEGEVLHELYAKYRRSSLKARDSIFNVELPALLPAGSTVYIEHHRTAKHENC